MPSSWQAVCMGYLTVKMKVLISFAFSQLFTSQLDITQKTQILSSK